MPATAINELEMWQPDTFDPARINLEPGWAAPTWFHEVFRTDGTPYDPKEAALIKSLAASPVARWQPVAQLPRHSTRAASRPAALRLVQIQTVFSPGAPCRPGASAFAMASADRRSLGGGWSHVSVPRGICATNC